VTTVERLWRLPVSIRGPLARVPTWVGLGCAGFLAVAGGLALRGPGLVAVGVGGLLAGCTAAGLAREATQPQPRSTVESAVQAAAWTVCGLLVVAGIAALAGGVVAALSVGAALAVLLVRLGRRRPAAGSPVVRSSVTPQWPPAAEVLLRPVPPAEGAESSGRLEGIGMARVLPPVAGLTTRELGREWARTTHALAGRLNTGVRASLVQRREQTLDELERRDPEGFSRWLAVGPVVGSDPADYVRGGPRLDGPAETDAA
jgi:hypothetical protein